MLFTNFFTHLYNLAFNIVVDFLDSIDLSTFLSNLYNFFAILCDILGYVFFFLPVSYLTPLLIIVFAVINLRIFISLVRFVLTLFPGW